jgi:predicted phage baseplate assembly protein
VDATFVLDPASGSVIAADPRRDASADVHAAVPAVALRAGGEIWTPAPDLLESSPFDRRFVAEVDDFGLTSLRFGDGEYGRELDPRFLDPAADAADRAVVTYRVGNGTRGEVGAESISHIVVNPLVPEAAWLAGAKPPPAVSNPLPAVGGVEPETIAEVRSRAPQAALAQVRAVTEDDYRRAVLGVPGVAQAAASILWTGTWHTAYVGVEPVADSDLLRLPDGSRALAAGIADAVGAVLATWRLAGCDVELGAPGYVGLEIELQVTVADAHFRTDVRQAVADVLSNRVLPDGTIGFFHHSQLQFGKAIFLSQVVAAAAAVPGVDAVLPLAFHPFGEADSGQLAAGVIPIGTFQIARLDGDPRNPDGGVLRVTATGGK